MTKQTAMFFLDFFEKLWIDKKKWSVKTEGKKVKKQTYFFPPLTKGFSKGALPSGYHTSHPPDQDIFCDWDQCTNPLFAEGKVLNCGHAYHEQCFINIGLKCTFCLKYFCTGVEELSKSYNKRLEMNMNLEEEFEELTQKNDDDESLDETDEFQNINTIDEGLTKAILGILIIYKSKSKYTEVFSFYLEFSE